MLFRQPTQGLGHQNPTCTLDFVLTLLTLTPDSVEQYFIHVTAFVSLIQPPNATHRYRVEVKSSNTVVVCCRESNFLQCEDFQDRDRTRGGLSEKKDKRENSYLKELRHVDFADFSS